MKILVLGASARNSIGYRIGERLRSIGHQVTYASRTGTVGIVCDITDHKGVDRLLRKVRPDVVIVAAGTYAGRARVGTIKNWKDIAAHLSAKSIGALIIANSIAKSSSKNKTFIVLGGRETSSEPSFAAYTVANGSLSALIRFLSRHTNIYAVYIDMPVIRDSNIANKLIKDSSAKEAADYDRSAVDFLDVCYAVERIIERKSKNGSRIILGGRNSP